MGQRTQVLQVIKTDLPELGENQLVSAQMVHNQWGFGKVMPLLFIGQLTRIYSMNIAVYGQTDEQKTTAIHHAFHGLCNSLKINTDSPSDYSEVFYDKDQEKQAIDKILNTTYAEIPKAINQVGDNNDGYMVMVFTIRSSEKFKSRLDIMPELAFITNSHKNPKYLTASQYMKQYIGQDDSYSIKPVIKALNDIASLYDDDWKNSPNQWANLEKHLSSDTLSTLKPFKTYSPALVA